MSIEITSTQNPRIKELLHLRKRSVRERERRFLIDGLRDLQRAVASGVDIEAIYFCPDQLEPGSISGLGPAIRVNPPILEKITYRENTEGFVAVAHMRTHELTQLTISENPVILVAASVEKPGNLGAMLRTADAAGVDALLVSKPAVDLYNPNVIRSSTGTVFSVPVAVAEGPVIRDWLDERGICGIAALPGAPESLYAADLRGPLAFFLGREQDGLSAEWQAAAGVHLAIPMRGLADSLNVSVTAAILSYEAMRQREGG